ETATDAPVVNISDEPFVPDSDGPGAGPGSNWQYGGTGKVQIEDLSTMGDYTGRSMKNVSNVKINMNLKKYGNGYGGVVTIGYNEEGTWHEGYFTSGKTEKTTQYNIWFTKSGNKVWHGFFEDYYGGLVIVIDGSVDLGDGDIDDNA